MFQQKFELSGDTQRGDNRLLSLTTEVQASLSIEKTKQLCVSIGQKELSGDTQRDDNHLLPLTTEV